MASRNFPKCGCQSAIGSNSTRVVSSSIPTITTSRVTGLGAFACNQRNSRSRSLASRSRACGKYGTAREYSNKTAKPNQTAFLLVTKD